MPRYVDIKPEDIEEGMTIRSREVYPSGTTVTYEGEIEMVNLTTLDFVGGGCSWKDDSGDAKVDLLQQVLPDLPNAQGSIILVDGSAAVRKAGFWYWATSGLQLVNVEDDETVEILHDAGK